ncbi:rRNA N6-adenosine-methyltransferase ZCCHC4 [Danio rerio]|uniref:rRNA N(6)-adenosine-methyltransferase ZCCHC4 n=1 Tax=Danio rerio TaxID=7955 RepID=A8WG80_DANRE|nr:rRNA N6-adenosine-methyltransferase ZCCHC4 [Danio rerio]AAI54612.1 Zgc:172248 protein [Danio rerio]AAI71462.1 Zgc:172248 [Danio rerio]|eukprot:NP_001107071.1 zinc finger CCHC domain-containing protein 4 [Danio rerio]
MSKTADDVVESGGIEVIVQNESDKTAPRCPHGPALLFEKTGHGEEEKGRRFYACSACRDRKDCNFFQWADEKISEARMLAREEQNCSKKPLFTHQQYYSRFLEFASLPLEQRRFCVDCQLLILPGEWMNHTKHRALSEDVTVQRLKKPSLLLRPLDNKKSNAQYLFAERSCHFLLDTLSTLGFRKLLCVGTPRLHEMIKIRNLEDKSPVIRSLLLDIDYRYCQFYGQDEFCRYNMFNHHFFDDEEAVKFFQGFLQEEGGEKLVMITDPPFGGLVKPLANSFSQISMTWKNLNKVSDASAEMPMIWIFPYFFESRILECFPSFSMLDYQVDYDNHPLYKHGKTGRKQSPVRLFTNLSPKDIILPEAEGYRFCSVCERYVSAGNKHCPKCDMCPSKDGREWRHCDECGRCVKPSWRHCSSCGRCALPDHPCGQRQTGCFNCGSQKHKLRACPKKRMLVSGDRGAPGLSKHKAGKSRAKNKQKRRAT